MKKNKFLAIILLSFSLILGSCSKDDNGETTDPADDVTGTPQLQPGTDEPEAIDLSAYDNGSRVMMQAFYWDVEPRFAWWDNLSEKVPGWADAGVERIWIPSPAKGQSGGYSMGYDPSDYFDFGNFEQHGTVETRFGSREELENLIAVSHDNDVEVIADIVLNHNSGGGLQYNPYRDYETYTLFNEENGNASGMFNRTYEDFYPNSVSEYDPGSLFYAETNLDHHRERVQDWLWKNDNSVAKYYKNVMGFDGWRFDYVKGFEPWVVKEWNEAVGGFSVGENFDGNPDVLRDWIEASGSPAFDFSTFYKLEESLDRYEDLTNLEKDMLWKTHPESAVTFTANHDTEKDSEEDNYIMTSNKMKAYAYILTHPGYPTIFYSDYENENFKEELKTLISIHNSIAAGDTEILYVDQDEYVMKRSGTGTNPGLILYISLNNSTKRRTVSSNWNNVTLMDYSGNSTYKPTSDENGMVQIEAPAKAYAIYSITE
ncbi:alpha-amylase [Christiangramia sediminis]|uniref:Alpha-amylase n=1 Tax=Christiangramia sediminis TaxID=2881336 RepID=A0A9X1RWF6_9FLAO|nr:alpha-amylase [Christiangramia sediminis]MCB7480726.1 alpha-amylase [Christiangramia sediminis]